MSKGLYMDSERFRAIWNTPLITLPDTSSTERLSAETARFLKNVGFPPIVRYGQEGPHATLVVQSSFRDLRSGLVTVESAVGARAHRTDYDDHVVFGREWVDGGAEALWSIDTSTGRVELIDIERRDPRPVLMNTSVQHLAKTLLALREWHLAPRADRTLDTMRKALESADPDAWPSSEWPTFVDHLEEVDLSIVVCDARDPNRS